MRLKRDLGVRALLALIAVTFSMLAGCYLVVFTDQKANGFDYMKAAGFMALGFYFGQSSPATISPPGLPTPPAEPMPAPAPKDQSVVEKR